MLIVKILYLAILIGLAVFCVLYIDSLAVIMLICMLVLPVFLLLSVLWVKLTCQAELLCQSPVTTTAETIPFTVSIVSRCPFPFPCVYADIVIRHAFGKESETMQMRFPLRGCNTTRMTGYIHAECCGTVDISIRRIRIYDYLRLFSCKVRVNERMQRVTVLPKRVQVPFENTAPPAYCEDSELYADIPGDDPSEITNLRDYVPGDAVSRIHWKLSSKSNRMIVKEFGMPVRKHVLLAVEHISTERGHSVHIMQQAETLLSLAYSLSCELLEAEIPFEIAWYSPAQEKVLRFTPQNSASLIDVFCKMFLSVGRMTLPVTELTTQDAAVSSLICMSNHTAGHLAETLSENVNALQKTVVFVSDASQTANASSDDVTVIHLHPDAVQKGMPTLNV